MRGYEGSIEMASAVPFVSHSDNNEAKNKSVSIWLPRFLAKNNVATLASCKYRSQP